MTNFSFLKNPIIIGILAGVITYLYIYWSEQRKIKKNPNIKKRPINLITPAVVAVIVWFLSSSFLNKKTIKTDIEDIKIAKPVIGGNKIQTNLVNNEINNDSIMSQSSRSYYLIGKNNVKLPPTDVFIDLADF